MRTAKHDIKMTREEKRQFNLACKDMIAEGYPKDVAEQRAWDMFYAHRIYQNNLFKEIF